MKKIKVILSGGGTGGHIYPAVAVAEALQRRFGDGVEILFVGAEGRMEMEKVPALGYKIVGLPIAGLQRRFEPKNLLLPIKVVRSIMLARKAIADFKANIVVGFGGYASAPVLWMANHMGVPTVIQEQNSYAGLTNKIVGRGVSRVCVAYEGMERFFDKAPCVMTGNPLRGSFGAASGELRDEALRYFGLSGDKKTILVVGGSLGTRTLNNMMCRWIEHMGRNEAKVQVIWQTGKIYEAEMQARLAANRVDGVWQGAFLERMDLAYAAADVVISRSGACTVSELCLVAKPTIFVPSPNVAEDHQTKNAEALAVKGAALMVSDSCAVESAMTVAEELAGDSEQMARLSESISRLAFGDAADRVVDVLEEVLRESEKKRNRK